MRSATIGHVYISARVDYATRALLALASSAEPLTGEAVAASQQLPTKFIENLLVELRRSGLVTSQRGSGGGYRLAKDPKQIAIADVFRAVEGPLAEVRGERPEHVSYDGAAEHLQSVWIAVRASLREVLEQVSVADVASGRLPKVITRRIQDPDSWAAR